MNCMTTAQLLAPHVLVIAAFWLALFFVAALVMAGYWLREVLEYQPIEMETRLQDSSKFQAAPDRMVKKICPSSDLIEPEDM